MTREIKFRAWDLDKKKYVLLQEAKFSFAETFGSEPYGLKIAYASTPNREEEYCGLEGLLLEPSTGLKDKNGKEIYEGDLIKQLMYVLDGKECIVTWVVRWNNDEFCYDLHRVVGALYGDSMLSTCESKDCEVIGNIHENPELLGGKA